jgi:RNA polymerase sigma-70 factor (ECF subfamily)
VKVDVSKHEHEKLDFTGNWVKTQPIVTSYIFGLVRNRHDAEDLLQDVAAEAFRNFAQRDTSYSFIAWAITIARHRTMDYFRRQSVQSRLFEPQILTALASAHQRLAESENDRRLALEECLKTLGKRGLAAIEMRYREGVSVSVIAKRFETSAQTVSTLLYKARQTLGDCIARRLSVGWGDR